MKQPVRTAAEEAWRRATNVLCVRLDSIGDVLMTTPALRALKESAPGRRVTLLTSASGAEAAGCVPGIDSVMTFAAPWMKAARNAPEQAAEDYRMIESLAAKRFDAAVIFTVYSQNPLPAAYLCYLAGIPLRLAHCHENPYELLTDWLPDPEPAKLVRHEVRRQLDLVAAVGCTTRDERLSFAVRAGDRARVRHLLAELGIDRSLPLVVVHPGATAASRRYPAQRFAQALDLIASLTGCTILLTGDAGEGALVASVAAAMRSPAHDLHGRLDLPELGALIAQADLVVTNNTGPAHVAAAVGTPLVVLYALTNPQHTPWMVESRVLFHDVPCRCCYRSMCPEGHNACLAGVAPEEVADAALALLGTGMPLVPHAATLRLAAGR